MQKGFTLIELVVVVTILAVLSTVGTMSYIGYSADARDSVRISDIRNIERALEFYALDNGSFPTPDNAEEITLSGSTVWEQGTFGDENYRAVKRLSEKPMDPRYNIEYTYSLLHNSEEYQISTIFEGSDISFSPFVGDVHARDIKAFIAGNYNERITYLEQGGDDIILALPSITTSSNSSLELQGIIDENNLVFHNKSNLPSNYNVDIFDQSNQVESNIENIIAFSGSLSELVSYEKQREFIMNMQNAYSESVNLSKKAQEAHQKVQNIDLNSAEQMQNYIDFLSENNIGSLPNL